MISHLEVWSTHLGIWCMAHLNMWWLICRRRSHLEMSYSFEDLGFIWSYLGSFGDVVAHMEISVSMEMCWIIWRCGGSHIDFGFNGDVFDPLEMWWPIDDVATHLEKMVANLEIWVSLNRWVAFGDLMAHCRCGVSWRYAAAHLGFVSQLETRWLI